MSTKPRPSKKMSQAQFEYQAKKNSDAIQSVNLDPTPMQKPLALTPQLPVTIHGTFPDQWLTVEARSSSGTRRSLRLTPDNAYGGLLGLLQEKSGEIELERQLAAERANKPARRRAQPDWTLIAKHPEAVIIQRLSTKSPELTSLKAELNLEDMGL